MAEDNKFNACLDLLRHLPPHQTEENLERLVQLQPELEADLRNAVDVPCRILVCPQSNREFLACDYNRVSDFYRSPWSLIVVNEQGEVAEVQPESSLPARLRSMEMLANKAFDSYRQLYYDGGISSVYFWPVDEESGSFGSAILLKKAVEDAGDLVGASWDAIHVAEVEPSEDKAQFILRMTSTILLDLQGAFSGIDAFRLGGSLTRQLETTISAADDIALVAAIGKAVEEQEGRMRSNLQEIYFGKTHEVINELRPALPEGYLRNQADFAAEMSRKLRC